MNIESMAVSAVQNAISKTDYLGEQISKGDKEPSWDGSIYVYNTPADNHKKEDFLLVNYVEFLLPSLCNDLMQ